MSNCPWTQRVERWFDAESAEQEAVLSHMADCPACTAYVERLRMIRAGVASVTERADIQDGQFPAFMDGIRERIHGPARRHPGLWTFASVGAAALLMAVSAFVVFGGRTPEVRATAVESYSTELEDATITEYVSENGVSTLWVTVTEGGDIL